MTIYIKRAYEPAAKTDGLRVLVDRLWPRGVTKAKAKLDLWAKDVTPSNELRKWFHADPEHRYADFVRRYRRELKGSSALSDLRKVLSKERRVTFVTAAKDVEHSHSPVLIRALT